MRLTEKYTAAAATITPDWYRGYVLALLVLVGICSWTDRQIFSILLQPIKKEFGLSDTAMGLLGGTAFGLFYVTAGLPIAWLADRSSRRNIIAGSTALWSVMTALSGTATGFVSLFLCRMGVGIGEAGGAAPSQSLLSDYFAARRRALAMGVLYSYLPLGYLLSYSLGGWLSDAAGWRSVFILFGLPGVLLAVIFRATVREPARGLADHVAAPTTPAPSFASTIQYFLRSRSLRQLPLAGAAHGIGMFGAAVWMPAYLMRTFDLNAAETGLRLAVVMGVGGIAGVLAGGQIVDQMVARTGQPRWSAHACSVFLLLSIPFTVGTFVSDSANGAMLLFAIAMVLNHMVLGPVVATTQNLAGVSRRAMAAAFYLFLVNLLAASLGPLVTGSLSDVLLPRFGADSLRYSLLILMPITCAWASLHFYLAGRSIARDRELTEVTPRKEEPA